MLSLCRTFGCLPSQLEKEDASILRLVKIAAMGMPGEGGEDGERGDD